MSTQLLAFVILVGVILFVGYAMKNKMANNESSSLITTPTKYLQKNRASPPTADKLITLRHYTQLHPDVQPQVQSHGQVSFETAQEMLKAYLNDNSKIYLLGFGEDEAFFQVDRDTDGSLAVVMLDSPEGKFIETKPSYLSSDEINEIMTYFWKYRSY